MQRLVRFLGRTCQGLCTGAEGEEVRVVQNLRPWNRQCGCHVHTSVKHVSLKVWLYKRSWEANTINKLMSLHECSRCTTSWRGTQAAALAKRSQHSSTDICPTQLVHLPWPTVSSLPDGGRQPLRLDDKLVLKNNNLASPHTSHFAESQCTVFGKNS